MATTVQFRRGTTAQNDAFTGAEGELSVDVTLDQLRIHDGSTAGGFKVARQVDLDDRMQVANTNTLVSDRMQVANTNTLVSDRMQVANAVSKTSTTDQSMKATLAVDSEGASSGVHIANGAISIYSATGNPSYVDFYCEVTNAHYTRLQAAAHADYTGNVTLTSPTTSGTIALESDVNSRLGDTATVTMVGDLTGSNSFSSNATSIVTTLASTGTPTGTFGSGSLVPVITVDAKGRITNISNTSVAGVSDLNYYSANSTLRIDTADGSQFDATISTNDKITVANAQALVAARLGATATVALTGDVTASATAFSSNAASISTTIASNSVDGSKLTDNIVIAENLVVSGNLTVSGTQTTVNSNQVNIGDAILTLNSDLGGGVAASEDAGITINRGSDANVSFIYDESEDQWSLGSQQLVVGDIIPNSDGAEDLGTTSVRWRKLFTDAIDITNDVDVGGNLTVTGSINATVEGQANTAAALSTARAIQLGGDLSGSANFDGSSDITITATIQNNSVALGTDTTGNYVGTVTGGTGIASSGATTGEGIAHTLSVDLSELTDMTAAMVGTDEFIVLDAGADRRKAASEIGLSIFNNDAGFSTTTGTVTSVATGGGLTGGTITGSGTISHADTSSQASVNNSGRTYIQDITLDTYGHVTAISSATETVTDTNTNQLTTFQLEDGDGTEVTISHAKEVKFVEGGGIDINWTDTSNGTDGDPYDLTFTINTGVTAGSGLTGGGTLNATRTISHADTSSQASVNNSGRTYIQDITLDTYGHVTGIASATETVTDTNTTYTAGGDYGMTLSGTEFRLENDRRRNSSTDDIYSGNTHDYTHYDSDTGIRWYTAAAEEMRLENDGDLHVDGDVVAFSTTVSDRRLKENILQIDDALEKVSKISGYTFDYKHNGKSGAGVIAQEIEEVLPSAVTSKVMEMQTGDAETEYKTVEYDQVIGLLVSAINELQVEIAELKKQ